MSESFIIYTSYLKVFEQLTDAQLGKLTRCMLTFAKTGEEPAIEDPIVKLSFAFIKDDIERNQKKYEEKCEKLRANAQKRWNKKQLNAEAPDIVQKQANGCKSMQLHTNAQIAMHNGNDNANDNDNDVTNVTDSINIESSKEASKSTFAEQKLDPASKPSKEKSSKIDYAAIKEYWNTQHDKTGSAMPRLTLMTENRKVMVKARLRQCGGDKAKLKQAIDQAMGSDFMNGNNSRNWVGKFDWIFGNEQNFTKVLEGNYDNEESRQQPAAKGNQSLETGRETIGERWAEAKHQQPQGNEQQSQDNKYRVVISSMLEDLRKNPSNRPAQQSLERFYEAGVLQRLGIDWKPKK